MTRTNIFTIVNGVKHYLLNFYTNGTFVWDHIEAASFNSIQNAIFGLRALQGKDSDIRYDLSKMPRY